MSSTIVLRTFVVYVEDQPGVLNRVDSLFRRRGYNIVSINAGRTHEQGVSRITLVVEADDDTARRIQANLYKLVNVLSVEDITGKALVGPGLALIKIQVGPERRSEVLQLCEVLRARLVDIGSAEVIIEIAATPDEIEAALSIFAPFGIEEMVQTGRLAMTRGRKGDAACAARPGPALRRVVA